MALERFGVSMEGELLARLDAYVSEQGYPNRSQALRELVQHALVDDRAMENDAEVVGTLSVVYDHHQRELAAALLHIQHQTPEAIICTTHVHLNHQQCLELLLLRGRAGDLRQLAEKLRGLKGVARGELILSPVTSPSLGHHHLSD